jgi:iron complex outermembrane receptor protein
MRKTPVLALPILMAAAGPWQLAKAQSADAETTSAADLPTIPVSVSDTTPIPTRVDAPGEPPTQLEEIIVTATKREKSTREIPATINAISGEQLEKMGAHDVEDYIALTPGITLQEGAYGDVQSRNITIRGVGSSTLTNQAVGQFIGDIPMTDPYSNFTTPDLDPFDLKTVEILKGPQGTYFGASALNGAIRYVPNAPELGVWNGRGYIDYLSIHDGGAAPSYGAALNVPIDDSIALRASGVLQHTPGVIDNLQRDEKDADSRRKWSGRVAGRWEATDDLSVNLTYLKQASHADDVLPVDNSDEQLTNNSHPGPSSVDSGFSLMGADIRQNFGSIGTLVIQGSHQTKRATFDADAGTSSLGSMGIQSLRGYFNADIMGNTGEIRLVSPNGGDWNWIIGAFGLDYHATVDTDLYVANTDALSLLQGVPIVGALATARGLSLGGTELAPLKATETAVFGELSRRLWEKFELTGGVRFYRTAESGVETSSGATSALIGTFPVSQGDDGISPKLSLAYKANRNFMAYAALSRGFQFGGVNATTSILPFNNPITGTPTPPTFQSSTLWNREVGIRTDWFDRTLRADLTYFNLDWNKAQFNQTQVNLVLTNSFVSNVGKVNSQGVEAAVSWLTPIAGLSLNTSMAYTSALTKVSFTGPNGDVVPSGTQMPATPHWQTAATATYTWYMGKWISAASLTDTYSSKAYNNLQHSAAIYDANLQNIDFSISRPDWLFAPALAIGIVNLMDHREVVGYTDGTSLVSDQIFYNRPRSISIRLTAEFR